MVSLFAVLGGLLKPRSFAGLFSAAPSVALAILALTILTGGKLYVSRERGTMRHLKERQLPPRAARLLWFVEYASAVKRLRNRIFLAYQLIQPRFRVKLFLDRASRND